MLDYQGQYGRAAIEGATKWACCNLTIINCRHIVVHASNRYGFASKTNTGHYHGDMNEENFLKWLEHQLLISLKGLTFSVMDNASYHSTLVVKDPATSWWKGDMQQRIRDKNIPFKYTMLKTQLLGLINRHKQPKGFKADELSQQYGHEVLRLLPYHCIFNPIELIWGVAKIIIINTWGQMAPVERSPYKYGRKPLNR